MRHQKIIRTKNTDLFIRWLAANRPKARKKLAKMAGVSESLVSQMARETDTRAPRPENRYMLSKVMGVPVDELFPTVPNSGNRLACESSDANLCS